MRDLVNNRLVVLHIDIAGVGCTLIIISFGQLRLHYIKRSSVFKFVACSSLLLLNERGYIYCRPLNKHGLFFVGVRLVPSLKIIRAFLNDK